MPQAIDVEEGPVGTRRLTLEARPKRAGLVMLITYAPPGPAEPASCRDEDGAGVFALAPDFLDLEDVFRAAAFLRRGRGLDACGVAAFPTRR